MSSNPINGFAIAPLLDHLSFVIGHFTVVVVAIAPICRSFSAIFCFAQYYIQNIEKSEIFLD